MRAERSSETLPEHRETELGALLVRLRAATDPKETLHLFQNLGSSAESVSEAWSIAEATLLAGQAHFKLGALEDALTLLNDSHRQAVQFGWKVLELRVLTEIGRVHQNLGNFDQAADHLRRVLEESRVLSDVALESRALNFYAGLQHARGEHALALESLTRLLVIHRFTEGRRDQAVCLINIGVLHIDQGDYARALESLFEARALLGSQVDDSRLEGNCLINIGRAYEDMREYDQAASIYKEALELARKHNDRLIEAMASVNLATAHKLLEHPDVALPLFQRGLEITREIGLRQVEIAALDGIGTVKLAFQEFAASLESHREALRLARDTGYREQEVESLVNLARTHLAMHNPELALELLLDALPLAQNAELQKFVVEAHCLLSEAYEALGDTAAALKHHREYHQLERWLFNFEAERRTKHLKMNFELERARNETEAIRKANELLEHKVSERTQELEEARLEIVTRLALAAEYRDDTTGQHTQRVGTLAARIAQHLGMGADEVELLRLAARLHDVGKIGVSDVLMLKPGKLTPEEFERIKLHTTIGAQILGGGQSPLLQLAEVVALTHHERWDGRGYPAALGGDAIPLPGRIVAVADVFDALISHRPYKAPWTTTQARAEIERGAGTQFDPAVVAAFLEVVGE